MRNALYPILLAAGMSMACTTEHSAPTSPGTPLFAKGGSSGGGKVVNPRAIFTYHHIVDGVAAGLIGDGRAANGGAGSPTESIYDDGQCGVTATIFASLEGDATLDPVGAKATLKNCSSSAPRTLIALFGNILGGANLAPAQGGHFSNVRAVLDLAEGESGERLFTLLLRGGHPCERVRYDANVSAFGHQGSRVVVTRTSESEWVAASQPNADGRHVAFCQVGGSGGVGEFYNPGSQLGAYDMPLRITVQRK